jgi:hypothetical protein
MGRIHDAILILERTEDGTDRALQLAGLISTLFKIKGVGLVVTGQLAYEVYANTSTDRPSLELAVIAGDLAPRTVMEIMRGQLYARGSIYQWTVAGIPVSFYPKAVLANIDMCRDFTTSNGVVLVLPVEEILADRILAAVYPEADSEMHEQAHSLLVSGLAEAFIIDWTVLHTLCHRPDYRIGEELAKMRLQAKRDIDAMGAEPDRIGATGKLPMINVPMLPESGAVLEGNEVNVVVTPAAELAAEKAAAPAAEETPLPVDPEKV